MNEWTPSQRDAIETKNTDLLVSAGAGSGKTSVLTERLVRRITEGGDIGRMLVVTFGNAAASDIRDKLREELTRAYAAQPANRHLRNQLYRLSDARVCTVHSFCLEIIKNNFSLLGASPRLRVADGAERAVISRRSADECVEWFFENGGDDFFGLVSNFDDEKSDGGFVELIMSIYDKIRSYPDYLGFLDRTSAALAGDVSAAESGGVFACSAGSVIRGETRRLLGKALTLSRKLTEFAELTAVSERNIAPCEEVGRQIELLFCALENGYSAFREAVRSYSVPPLYTRGMDAEQAEVLKREKEKIKKYVDRIAFLYTRDEAAVISDIAKTAGLLDVFSRVIKKYDELYSKAKRRISAADFPDLEHMALALLAVKEGDGGYSPTPVCLHIRENTDEIYIDEYQDINALQDLIFTLVSRGGNRFMVGDVKQSIYRFRNAEPDIFLAYRNAFEDGKKGRCITLRENFRCGRCIIDFVNAVFSPVYTKENTGTDYKKEALVFSKGGSGPDIPVRAALCDLSGGANTEEGVAAEARFVAGEIKRLVSEGYLPDGKKISYSDIAVLFRSVKGLAEPFEKEFRRAGIPFQSAGSTSLMQRPEIQLALSVLKAVDNPSDDIAVAATMRSPVFSFTAEELYEIARCSDAVCFYDKVIAYTAPYRNANRARGKRWRPAGGRRLPRAGVRNVRCGAPVPLKIKKADMELSKKCCGFVGELVYLRTVARGCASHTMIWTVLERCSLSAIAESDDDGVRKTTALRRLYALAYEFEKNSFKGLSAFLDHFDSICEGYAADGPEISFSPSGEDCVRLMSVHKSKGLEFPVCFVAGLGKKFNFKDTSAPFLLDPSYGAAFRLREGAVPGVRDTLLRRAAAVSERKKLICDELRILYVALTRGRDILYVSASVKDPDCGRPDFEDTKSYADWLVPALKLMPANMADVRLIDPLSPEGAEETGFSAPPAPAGNGDASEAAAAAAGYDYPYAAACASVAKMSVSELRKGLLDDSDYERVSKPADFESLPSFISGASPDPALRGTANHLFMQFASFDNVDANGVEAEIERLCGINMISAEQARLIDVASAEKFFAGPLYAEMRASRALYREKRFTVSESDGRFVPVPGEAVLIQGVVDCFYLNPDGTFTVVDYKTDRVPDSPQGEELLRRRHSLQLGYYCRAVSRMTGRPVSAAYLYSFPLGRAVKCDIPR